jgi:hypothetical protein
LLRRDQAYPLRGLEKRTARASDGLALGLISVFGTMSGRSITAHFANRRRWLVPAPRYTRYLRTIRFLRRTIQFYDGYAIDLCELIRALYLVRMRSEETKDEAE